MNKTILTTNLNQLINEKILIICIIKKVAIL